MEKYIAIVLCTLFICVTLLIITNNIKNVFKAKILINKDLEFYKLQYDAKAIVGQLDDIINRELDYYILMNIKSKQIFYINSSMEKDMTNVLIDEISAKIPLVLYTKLSLIVGESKINDFIAKEIYLIVLQYVLDYNMVNTEDKIK